MKKPFLSTIEAAAEKAVSREAIRLAIGRGDLDAFTTGRFHFVENNRKFQTWEPNRTNQENARGRKKEEADA